MGRMGRMGRIKWEGFFHCNLLEIRDNCFGDALGKQRLGLARTEPLCLRLLQRCEFVLSSPDFLE
jgi:hypothetical protein